MDAEHGWAGTNDFALYSQLALQLMDLVFGFGQVIDQLLFAESGPQCHPDGLGDGQREFQIQRLESFLGVGRIQVQQPDNSIVQFDWRHNHAGGMNLSRLIADAEGTVVLDVSRQNSFLFLQRSFRQEFGDAVILGKRIASPGQDIEIFRVAGRGAVFGTHQQTAGVRVRDFEQAVQRHAGDGSGRRFVGQIESQAAQSSGIFGGPGFILGFTFVVT